MKIKKRTLIIVLILNGFSYVYSQNQSPVNKIPGVSKHTIHSEILNENRLLFIYLPVNSKNQDLPVLYILDGQGPLMYKEAIENTKDNPHILVGVVTTENRNRDMIPVVIANREGSGGSTKFLRFLNDELQPYIEKNFQTNGEDILFGASNSGLFTIYALLDNPDSFSAYIASSPMIGHCSEFMIQKLEQFNKHEIIHDKFLYIHWGMKDNYTQVTKDLPPYIDLLNTFLPDLRMEVKGLENGTHVPPGGIKEGLDFIYKK